MLTIIMPPAPAAPDSSQSIIRQVFTRHRHGSCPATRHGRPNNIKHGDPGVTYEPGSQSQLLQCTTQETSCLSIVAEVPGRQFHGCNISPVLAVWRSASGGGTWSHSVRSRAAAERKIGADQPPATVPVFTAAGRYVDR